jgi:predicted Zn-dependent protease
VAKQPGADVLILLQEVQRPAGRAVEEIALRSMEGAAFRPTAGSRTTINGLDAFVGTYQGALQAMGRVTVRAAHIVNSRPVFLVAGIAPQQTYPREEVTFTRALNSFRPMTAGEAEAIRPNRIALHTARGGDTWQSIADRQGKGAVKASTLATMNGHVVNDQPRAGERLKIVAAG